MQARQIMTTPVVTVQPEVSVRAAAALLLEHRITAAPVIDSAGDLIGMISEGDLVVDRFGHDPRSQLRPVEDEPPGAQTVGEAMTTPVVALSPSADAADLAETMLNADVRSIPILEGDAVVGIVSRRDLLRTLIRDDDAIRAEILLRLADYVSSPHRWDVQVTDGRVVLVGPTDSGSDSSDSGSDSSDSGGRAVITIARTVPGVNAVHLAGHLTPVSG